MAGKIVVSTLNNDTGVLATQNGMTGIAKAWVNFNGSATPATVTSSFNISSVTRSATGVYYASFTTAMPDTTYSLTGSAMNTGLNQVYFSGDDADRAVNRTGSFYTFTWNTAASSNANRVCITIFSA